MGLSIAALHQPLNDFFLERFGGGADGQVVFRFEKFGSVLSDDDFMDEAHPELGPLGALATERFSDLVNRVPADEGDGVNVVSSAASIDDLYYYRLLKPSRASPAKGMSKQDATAAREAFNELKADAIDRWEDAELVSLSGLALAFKPSYATPEDWYRADASASWTKESFTISGETKTSSDPGPLRVRLRPSDDAVAKVLRVDPAPRAPIDLRGLATALRRRVQGAGPEAAPRLTSVREIGESGRARLAAARLATVPVEMAPVRISDTLRRSLRELEVRDRVVLNTAIAAAAPTEVVHTDTVRIELEHCLVRIERPWMVEAFLHHGGWRVPGLEPGSLSEAGAPGALQWLPVAAVAVRALDIAVSWDGGAVPDPAEVAALGPFAVTGSVDGRLTQPGTQVIGWLLQRVPSLPPA